nr:truncated pyrazinamidase [Mycobacterium tuberculosis]
MRALTHCRRAERLLRGWLAGGNRWRRAGPRHQRLPGRSGGLPSRRGNQGLPHRPG